MGDNTSEGCFSIVLVIAIMATFIITNWRTNVSWRQYLVDEEVARWIVNDQGESAIQLIKPTVEEKWDEQ